jgi:hypothetical protein
MIAWAVVKDDNLHPPPKRALVTLPAACGFRVFREKICLKEEQFHGSI